MVPNADDGYLVVDNAAHQVQDEQQKESVVLMAHAVVYPGCQSNNEISLVNSK